MKSTIVENAKVETVIDWDKNQILRSFNKTDIVLTNGKHNLSVFSGVIIKSNIHFIGDFSGCWVKENFAPIDEITINFKS